MPPHRDDPGFIGKLGARSDFDNDYSAIMQKLLQTKLRENTLGLARQCTTRAILKCPRNVIPHMVLRLVDRKSPTRKICHWYCCRTANKRDIVDDAAWEETVQEVRLSATSLAYQDDHRPKRHLQSQAGLENPGVAPQSFA